MVKTTVYMPQVLKRRLERMAREEGLSEAEIIRKSIQRTVEERRPPKPRIPLSEKGLGDPTAAERVEELLKGFGSS